MKNDFKLRASFTVFLILILHGATLGMTDDEAYYWVLSQSPALGYAFHPPVVAWMVALFDGFFSFLGLGQTSLSVRFPAALISGVLVYGSLFFIESARSKKATLRDIQKDTVGLISLVGLFGASWMMVPDLPLFLGFLGLLLSVRFEHRWGLFFGAALVLLSKFSGVLLIGSAAVLLWRDSKKRIPLLGFLLAGSILGGLPTLIWNLQHDWASVLYQIRDRQSGDWSLKREFKFWAIQVALVGPALWAYFFVFWKRMTLKSKVKPTLIWLSVWILPGALIYGLQPLKAEFKVHWSLVFWFPLVLAFILEEPEFKRKWIGRLHRGFGILFLVLSFTVSHTSILPFVSSPKQDVSGDMRGWNELPAHLKALGLSQLPVVGSRYQTASQAAFALGGVKRATLIPRDSKQRDEWFDLGVTDSQGPEWPTLLKPVVFVADTRYNSGPEFKQASCEEKETLKTLVFGRLAKEIRVWHCKPR